MNALIYNNKNTTLDNIKIPNINEKFNVLVNVTYSGICRTDMYVSEGKIENQEKIILGHEFCGYVKKSKSIFFKKNDFIVCNPMITQNSMLGVDYNGSFAEYVIVPESHCFLFSEQHKKLAAYIEPIAASLAPLNFSHILNSKIKGAIVGNGRIAALTQLVLNAFDVNIKWIKNIENEDDNFYDFIIETWANEKLLNLCLDKIKPEGTLILKSRNPQKTPLDLYKIVRKEINIKGCYYYDFKKTIDFALNNVKIFDNLLGPVYDIQDWKKAFNESSNSEKKIFLKP